MFPTLTNRRLPSTGGGGFDQEENEENEREEEEEEEVKGTQDGERAWAVMISRRRIKAERMERRAVPCLS